MNWTLLWVGLLSASIGAGGLHASGAPKTGPVQATARPAKSAKRGKLMIYIGTYTGTKSKGIYRLQLNLENGALSSPELVAEIASPSFLALHPNRRFLYAVNEVGEHNGRPSGAVSAFAIQSGTGKLTFLNQQSSQGSGPCHLIVDKAGKNVLLANYGGGSVAALPIQTDGRLREATAAVQHKGHSVNPQRQEAPHAHSIQLDPANRFAVAADLGLDQLLVYRFDAEKGTLTPNTPPYAQVAPGAGPRHLAFHPNSRFLYVINELGNTVTAFAYKAEAGTLSEIQTISTLPQGFNETSYTAEVQIHPSGKFLYGSNRGHDSIAIFAVDPQTGKLRATGHQSTLGKTPRNFGIDPSGTWLLAANQESDTVVVFRIDPTTGSLTPTGHSASVPKPVCVRFVPTE